MTAALFSSITAETRTTLRVGVFGVLDETHTDPLDWSVTRVAGIGHDPVVVSVELTGASEAVLTVHPQVTPGATYEVTGPDVVAVLPPAVYSSPGGVGDYAEASTPIAARVVFPGSGVGSFSLSMWLSQPTVGGFNWFGTGYDAGSDGLIATSGGRTAQLYLLVDNNMPTGFRQASPPDDDSWVHFALVSDGTDLTGYVNGVAISPLTMSGTYSAQDTIYLFASSSAGPAPTINGEPGDLANIALFDRDLTSDEVAALYAAGRKHDITTASGGWPGETPPVLWDGDATAGAVPNSGSGGACDLVLNGAVTATVATPVTEVTVTTSLVETYEAPADPQGRLPANTLLAVLGRQLWRLAGVPATRLIAAWTPGETRLLVASTLHFPADGAVFVGALRFTYASKTSGSFEGVDPAHVTVEPLGVGALVTFDEGSRLADDGPEAPEPPAEEAPEDWFTGSAYLDF